MVEVDSHTSSSYFRIEGRIAPQNIMPCSQQSLEPVLPGKGRAGESAAPLSKFEEGDTQTRSLRAPVAMKVPKGTPNYALPRGCKNPIGVASHKTQRHGY